MCDREREKDREEGKADVRKERKGSMHVEKEGEKQLDKEDRQLKEDTHQVDTDTVPDLDSLSDRQTDRQKCTGLLSCFQASP